MSEGEGEGERHDPALRENGAQVDEGGADPNTTASPATPFSTLVAPPTSAHAVPAQAVPFPRRARLATSDVLPSIDDLPITPFVSHGGSSQPPSLVGLEDIDLRGGTLVFRPGAGGPRSATPFAPPGPRAQAGTSAATIDLPPVVTPDPPAIAPPAPARVVIVADPSSSAPRASASPWAASAGVRAPLKPAITSENVGSGGGMGPEVLTPPVAPPPAPPPPADPAEALLTGDVRYSTATNRMHSRQLLQAMVTDNEEIDLFVLRNVTPPSTVDRLDLARIRDILMMLSASLRTGDEATRARIADAWSALRPPTQEDSTDE